MKVKKEEPEVLSGQKQKRSCDENVMAGGDIAKILSLASAGRLTDASGNKITEDQILNETDINANAMPMAEFEVFLADTSHYTAVE